VGDGGVGRVVSIVGPRVMAWPVGLEPFPLDALTVEEAIGVSGCESMPSSLRGKGFPSLPLSSVPGLGSNVKAGGIPFALKDGMKA